MNRPNSNEGGSVSEWKKVNNIELVTGTSQHADYKYAENGSEDSASLSASHHEICEYLILMELRMICCWCSRFLKYIDFKGYVQTIWCT